MSGLGDDVFDNLLSAFNANTIIPFVRLQCESKICERSSRIKNASAPNICLMLYRNNHKRLVEFSLIKPTAAMKC